MKYVESDRYGSLYILDLETGELRRAVVSAPGEPYDDDGRSVVRTPSFERPCWFPDGGSILVDC
jgi:hypothetical protein